MYRVQSASPFSELDAPRRDTKLWLRSPDVNILTTEIETEALKRHRCGYIRGPLYLPEVCAAAKLPGKALAVWLFVQYRVRVTRKPEITLPNGRLVAAGIDRNAKARALRDLERAGLITVRREVGQTPRISLVAHSDAIRAT
jgi:hypothetical protein